MREQKLELKKLVDVKFLQDFQDAFAHAMNIACLIYDTSEPLTTPSNFTDFCQKYKRKSPEALKRCTECDIRWGKIASEKMKPVIYKCHTGLTDMAVPIIVEGVHIGTIFAGQILTEEPDLEKYRALAKVYGINEEEYIEAVKKIAVIPEKSIEAVADLLFLVANAFSEIGNHNFKLLKQIKKELLFRTVTETLRDNYDIQKTKSIIVRLVGETLSADRCFITEYNEEKDYFSIVSYEYLSSENVGSYKGMNPNIEIPNLIKELRNGNSMMTNNGKFVTNYNNLDFSREEEIMRKYNVNSSYVVPFKYYNKLLGVLSLHYTHKEHKSTKEELELVKMLAIQVGIAMHQAKLFDMLKKQTKREKFISKISDILRSSLEKKVIKHLFVQNIGKYFEANRVFFSEYDKDKKIFLPSDKESEYLSDSSQISFINYPWTNEDSREYIEPLINKRELIISNLDEYLEKNYKSPEFIKLFKDAQVKSSYNFPVLYEQKLMGYFCIEFTNDINELAEEDIACIRSICSQAGIALYHSMLYAKANQEVSSQYKIIKRLYDEIKITIKEMLEYSNKILNNGEDPLQTKEYIRELKEKEDKILKLLNEIPEV